MANVKPLSNSKFAVSGEYDYAIKQRYQSIVYPSEIIPYSDIIGNEGLVDTDIANLPVAQQVGPVIDVNGFKGVQPKKYIVEGITNCQLAVIGVGAVTHDVAQIITNPNTDLFNFNQKFARALNFPADFKFEFNGNFPTGNEFRVQSALTFLINTIVPSIIPPVADCIATFYMALTITAYYGK